MIRSIQKPLKDHFRHESLKSAMQRLRGRIYLHDGAIKEHELAPDNRHISAIDDDCWHLLSVSESDEVLSCIRLRQHGAAVRFDDLGISESALAQSERWGANLRAAVEQDLRLAALAEFSYVEVGGWAIAEKIRCSAECLRSVLSIYAWSRLTGGALGVSGATERNGSASILRRLGGHPMNLNGIEIPPYFDPRYNCRMHLLRYDSRKPASRYEAAIEEIQCAMAGMAVIQPDRPAWQPAFTGTGAAGFTAGESAHATRTAA
jgi:hypothetical protein